MTAAAKLQLFPHPAASARTSDRQAPGIDPQNAGTTFIPTLAGEMAPQHFDNHFQRPQIGQFQPQSDLPMGDAMLMEEPNSRPRNVLSHHDHPVEGCHWGTLDRLEFQQEGEGNPLPAAVSSAGCETRNHGGDLPCKLGGS